MSPRTILSHALPLGTFLLMLGCGPQIAGVRIDFIGKLPPKVVQTTGGKCSAVEVAIPGEVWYVECGVGLGLQRFAAECGDAALPKPVLELQIPKGDSHYMSFFGACDATSAQIEAGNLASQGKWKWTVGGV